MGDTDWDMLVWDTPVSDILVSDTLVLLLLLSLLLEDFMLELDVMLPTLLEPSMSPRERLMLTLTTLLDTVWDTPDMDMLVLDTPDLDTLVSDTPDLDMLAWDTMLLAMPVSLPPLCEHRWSGSCCCPCCRRCLCWSWTLCCQLCWNRPCCLNRTVDHVFVEIYFLINILN